MNIIILKSQQILQICLENISANPFVTKRILSIFQCRVKEYGVTRDDAISVIDRDFLPENFDCYITCVKAMKTLGRIMGNCWKLSLTYMSLVDVWVSGTNIFVFYNEHLHNMFILCTQRKRFHDFVIIIIDFFEEKNTTFVTHLVLDYITK